MKKPKSDYAIQTVSNALRLLEAFQGTERLGVTELSRVLGLDKNNVFRLLATLEQAGYIDQCAEDDQYRLGVRCLELGHSYAASRNLLRRARPVLESLSRELGETVHIAVERGFDVIHLDGEVPDQLVVTASRVGKRLPIHCTALGKVLLGCADETRWQTYDREVASTGSLEERTRTTITDRDKLFEQLRAVKGQGWAVDVEECEAGLCCVAAPVLEGTGQVIAAISVSGPTARLDEEQLVTGVVPVLTAATADLSRQLGHS